LRPFCFYCYGKNKNWEKMKNKTGTIAIQDALKKASQHRKEASSWRVIEGLGRRYKLFSHEEIIFSMIMQAQNQLQSESPTSFDNLERCVAQCIQLYKRDRGQREDQRFYEDLRLKCDLEPAAEKIIMQGSSHRHCSINFTQISGYLGEIQTRKKLEPLYDALTEIETSNIIIRSCNKAISLIDTQTDTFHAWTQSTEYQQFKTVYGKLRNQQIKQSRQIQPQRILDVR
jgi:hypothetical protein